MPFIVKFSYMYIFLNIFTLIIPYCSPPTPDYLLFTPWQAQSCASQHASGSARLTALSHLQDVSTAPASSPALTFLTAAPVGVH